MLLTRSTINDCTDAVDGYALADHVVRTVTPHHRAAIASALLDRYPEPRGGNAFVRGFHHRLHEFIDTATPSTKACGPGSRLRG